MRIAVVQMTSVNRLETNLEKMHARVAEAASQKAELIAFPEMAYFMGRPAEWQPLLARYDEITRTFASWAETFGVYLLPGSLCEPTGSSGRYFNTLPVFDPRGKKLAAYRKIFLFKARLPDRSYDEADRCDAGEQAVCFEGPNLRVGLSICYDVRFPELFRTLKKQGMQCVVLPASFTVPTGTAHWETLLRARAIENQVFVAAPAQVGEVGDGARTYGHSAVFSPWGERLAMVEEGEGLAIVDLDVSRLAEASAKVDAWRSRREDLFPFKD